MNYTSRSARKLLFISASFFITVFIFIISSNVFATGGIWTQQDPTHSQIGAHSFAHITTTADGQYLAIQPPTDYIFYIFRLWSNLGDKY